MFYSSQELKKKILYLIENFDIEPSNIANLLDLRQEEVDSIFADKEVTFSDDEDRKYRVLFTRLELLTSEYFLPCSRERVRLLTQTDLIENCKLSNQTLAKFAGVPLEIFESFLANEKVADKYLVDIYLNLYTLFILLYTKNEQYRSNEF